MPTTIRSAVRCPSTGTAARLSAGLGRGPRIALVWAVAAAIGLLLASCGDDDGGATSDGTTETEESTTETSAAEPDPAETEPVDDPESSETTAGEPAAGEGTTDVCATIDPALVEALLGPGASAGTPVDIEVPTDGCVWESAGGADVLATATVSAIPGAGETEDAFAMFGLTTEDYAQTSRSSGSGGESSEGEPGSTVVVITGDAESHDETEAENAALNEIFDLLDDVASDG